MNKVQLYGWIMTEPNLTYVDTKKGDLARVSFVLGCERPNQQNRKKGQKKAFDNVPCVAWGTIAEMIEKNLSRMNRLIVTNGSFTVNKYKDKSGNWKTSMFCTVIGVDFVDSKNYNGKTVTIGDNEIYLPSYGDDDLELPETPFTM